MSLLKKMLSVLGLIITVFVCGCSENNQNEVKEETAVKEVVYPDILNENQKQVEIALNKYEILDGKLYGYGDNSCGQLGIGKIDSLDTPYTQPVLIAENVIHVDAYNETVIFLNDKNELYGMGSNSSGQLGIALKSDQRTGDESLVSTPVLIEEEVQYAVTGINFIMILKKDGKLYVLGDNANGQLGDGTAKPVRGERYSFDSTPYSSEPVLVLDHVNFIACGAYTASAITEEGNLWIWGDNSYGQIGNGRKGNEMPTVSIDVVSEPYLVLKKIQNVRFDGNTVYAIDFENNIYIWGEGNTVNPKKKVNRNQLPTVA